MTESQTYAMYFLIGSFGVLLFLVSFVIISSRVRQRKQQQQNQIPADVSSSALVDSKAREQAIAEVIEKTISETQPEPVVEVVTPKSLQSVLRNTESLLLGKIKSFWGAEQSGSHFEQMEEVLYEADLGPQAVERVLESVKDKLSRAQQKDFNILKSAMRAEFSEILKDAEIPEPANENPLQYLKANQAPAVWLIVGVNGAGKTTSIGKMAALLAQSGKRVLVAAGDTFRAAAGAQLKVWSDRAQVEIFSPESVQDPSAVAFDALMKAKAGSYDVVLVDTAGRLHTQSHLMDELKKMKRVMQKAIPDSPHEVLIVLDANSGQNALMQARQFNEALGLTGVILTKMDGTAKGGVVIGLAHELKVPIRMLGVGEKIGDLRPFSGEEYLNSLFNA